MKGRVYIHYWAPGGITQVGHIAFQTDEEYMSFYPDVEGTKFLYALVGKSYPGIISSKNADYIKRVGNPRFENEEKIVECAIVPPDKSIRIEGLNVQKINNFIRFLKSGQITLKWYLWGHKAPMTREHLFNCCTISYFLLRVGGINELLNIEDLQSKVATFFEKNKGVISELSKNINVLKTAMKKNPKLIKVIAGLAVIKSMSAKTTNPLLMPYTISYMQYNALLSPEVLVEIVEQVGQKVEDAYPEYLKQQKNLHDQKSNARIVWVESAPKQGLSAAHKVTKRSFFKLASLFLFMRRHPYFMSTVGVVIALCWLFSGGEKPKPKSSFSFSPFS